MDRCIGPGEGRTCGRKLKADGLCAAHYMQQRRGKALEPLRRRPEKPAREVTIHVALEAKEEAQKAAKASGVSLKAWTEGAIRMCASKTRPGE